MVILEQNCKVGLRSLVQINETTAGEAKRARPKSDLLNLCGRAAAEASRLQAELAALPVGVEIFPSSFGDSILPPRFLMCSWILPSDPIKALQGTTGKLC